MLTRASLPSNHANRLKQSLWLKGTQRFSTVASGCAKLVVLVVGAMAHEELEEGSQFILDWYKLKKVAACESPVVPVVVQHADTMEVLIVAYANEQVRKITQYPHSNPSHITSVRREALLSSVSTTFYVAHENQK